MDKKENIIVDFPLRGHWTILRPPGHHPYAFDFIGTSQRTQKYFSGNFWHYIMGLASADDFYGWSQPVFAPFDGVVVQASDTWPDNKKVNLISTIVIWFRATFLFRPKIDGSGIDIRPNAGNYVMIQADSGEVSFMAHMRCGSVKVSVGQKVIAGQMIGEVGNSGNTTAPHLHFNMFDQTNDLLKAKVIPCSFWRYERWNGISWEIVQSSSPQKKEIIRVQVQNE